MQTHRNFLPLALILLAGAIIFAGCLVYQAVTQASIREAQALGIAASATTAAASANQLAAQDMQLAAQRATLDAQHQANLRLINGG